MNILYVEDNADLRETIGELLEGPGRSVQCCADAEQALQVFAASAADVLVTDVNLPGMSGTDLTRRLLASQPQLQVVLCSGFDFGAHVRALGPNVHALVKPFELTDLDDLLAKIGSALAAAHDLPPAAP